MNSTSTTLNAPPDAGDCGCGCGGNACGCLPAEFTRLRYAYGLRLGAVELSDEQSYLIGKGRFHNARCHGAGVLCGLEAARSVWPQGSPPGTPSTVLRVSRGAALDPCGREVLVPCDQCIDVAAWFAKRAAKLDLPAGATSLALRVALRYRECPSDPAPVPRDPCGCDSAGCDYSRVREGFELALFAEPFPPCAGGTVFPDVASLLTAPADKKPDLPAAINAAAAAGCPQASPEEWLCLADFTATLTTPSGAARAAVSDITAPDNAIPGRRTLLSTGALQALVLELAGTAGLPGTLAAGPTLGSPGFTGDGTDAGTLTIPVNLLTDPGQGQPTPLAEGTFSAKYLKVFAFDPVQGKWSSAPTSGAKVAYDPGAGQFTVKWQPGGGYLSAGNYRVSLLSPDDQPVVDRRMRPLSPARFTCNFGLAADAANHNQLTWAPVSL